MNAAAPDYDFAGSASLTEAPDLTRPEGITDPDLAFDSISDDLAELKADLAKKVEKQPELLEVQTRPGYVAEFDTAISGAQIEGWRQRAKDRRKVDGVDQVKLAALILANKSIGLLKNGRRLTDGSGDPVTLRHEVILGATGAGKNAVQAVINFYGDDAELTAHSDAVLKASGWGEDATAAEFDPEQSPDPTQTRI